MLGPYPGGDSGSEGGDWYPSDDESIVGTYPGRPASVTATSRGQTRQMTSVGPTQERTSTQTPAGRWRVRGFFCMGCSINQWSGRGVAAPTHFSNGLAGS
jgi:hypothetical protein